MLKEVVSVLQDEERASFTHTHAPMEQAALSSLQKPQQERAQPSLAPRPSTDLIHTGRLADS